MNKISSYKGLIVWQKSINLVTMIYEVTRCLPDEERFGLTSQIRRSAISIPSNIAEGYGRGSTKSYLQFLSIARGSLFELETQIHIAKELQFLSEENSSSITKLISEIGRMINSLMIKIKNSSEKAI